MEQLKKRLTTIYGEQQASEVWQKLQSKLEKAKEKMKPIQKQKWDEEDIVLITYGDQFYDSEQSRLRVFQQIYNTYFKDTINMTHILPFYPYSSDDGFSVIDYKAVDQLVGSWEDVEALSSDTRLMFDFVCNHISAKSEWFQHFLAGDPYYQDFFITVPKTTDVTAVVRPRALPLLTPVTRNGETEYVWTTFSEDQVDLNFENPEVFLEMVDVLLFYFEKNAQWIRLDAVGFLWKELGTTCIHHPLTHEFIKLFRDITNIVATGAVLITETNVPHKDNISYFGDGYDEAQMVYQFPLPPLVLHAIKTGDSHYISQWADNLTLPSTETTYFNFLSSHDGIGVNPIRGIVPEPEILALIENLQENGALVSYKKNPDGTESPYEINVVYMNALANKTDAMDEKIKKQLVAHSILLTFLGVPALYIHSLLGTQNDYDGVQETGRNRSINRKKLDYNTIVATLENETTLESIVYHQLSNLIHKRKAEKAFHPNASLEVVNQSPSLFAFWRKAETDEVLVVHNITAKSVEFRNDGGSKLQDVLTPTSIEQGKNIIIKPYEYHWFKKVDEEK